MKKELEKAVEIVKEKYGERVVYVGLYGSQNYGIDTAASDYDFYAIILPTKDDVLSLNKTVKEIIVDKDNIGHINVVDLLSYRKGLLTSVLNYIEILFSKIFWVNPNNEFFYCLRDSKEKFAKLNPEKLLKNIYFTGKNNGKTVDKGPDEVISEYGYNNKKAIIFYRCYYMFINFNKLSYAELIAPKESQRNFWLKFKEYPKFFKKEEVENAIKFILLEIKPFEENLKEEEINGEYLKIFDDIISPVISEIINQKE